MKKPRYNRKMIMLCLALVISLVLLIACQASDAATVEVGQDNIVSVFPVIGEKKITGTRAGTVNGVPYKNLTYEARMISDDEIAQYIDALTGEGFVQIKDTIINGAEKTLQLAKQSVQDGKLILVDILHNSTDHTVLKYSVEEGTIV